ncbi:MAG: hypothetical protein IPK99_03340 [Flavobacteriales bacterium]|nr:hypothetical protein [Flavobacteriales bacterium]
MAELKVPSPKSQVWLIALIDAFVKMTVNESHAASWSQVKSAVGLGNTTIGTDAVSAHPAVAPCMLAA